MSVFTWRNYHFVMVDKVNMGSTQVLLCLLPGVLWPWHFLYSVGPHPVSHLYIYTFVVSRAFMAGAASQAGDADSSRTPGLTSGLQGSVNVHRGALLLVPQWQYISSFVFYMKKKNNTCTRLKFLRKILAATSGISGLTCLMTSQYIILWKFWPYTITGTWI